MIHSTYQRSPALPRGCFFDVKDLSNVLYLVPSGIVSGEQAASAVISGHGWPIADGVMSFTSAMILYREIGQDGAKVWVSHAPFAELAEWSESESPELARHVGRLVRRIGARRKDWAGMSCDRPRIMAVLNTTPDSFSDGGDYLTPERAIERARADMAAGASLIDVGGESTRPGSLPVSHEEEIARVLPVVKALVAESIPVSVDTRHTKVMEAVIAAGAKVINDISALEDQGAVDLLARNPQVDVCIMHKRGDPQTMQDDPHYDCAPLDVYDYLAGRIAVCEAAGIDRQRLCVDTGIGFGKDVSHNAQVIAAQALYHGLGCPILLGCSRKRFIAALSNNEPPKDRVAGSLAAHLAGFDQGVQWVRVHDVAQTAQALKVWHAIRQGA